MCLASGTVNGKHLEFGDTHPDSFTHLESLTKLPTISEPQFLMHSMGEAPFSPQRGRENWMREFLLRLYYSAFSSRCLVFVSFLSPPLKIESRENWLIIGKSKKHASRRDAIRGGVKCAIYVILLITASLNLHTAELKGSSPSPFQLWDQHSKWPRMVGSVSSSLGVSTQSRSFGVCH